VKIEHLDNSDSITHYQNARKAAIEYYFFEPLMPQQVLEEMRAK